jgi:hypothetical protein
MGNPALDTTVATSSPASSGLPPFPDTYWTGLETAGGVKARRAYNETWLASQEGLAWLSANNLSAEEALSAMASGAIRDRGGRTNDRRVPPYGEEPSRASDGRVASGKPAAAAAAVAATPPPALNAAGVASSAAQRQRRRAAAGNAGRVRTGTPTALQQQIGATSAPRTLIGS